MMRDKRTAIGIDICEGWIRMALVCRDERGVRLLKTVSAEVPVGTVKNGNIEDPGLLGKAVRKLKNSNKMRANRAAMSLVANPTVIQTVEMPKQIPVNIGQFVSQFNERTKDLGGMPVPVEITVYEDRTFTFVVKSPPAAALLKEAAQIAKGSGVPNKEKVGAVTIDQVRQIAERKMNDLNAHDIDSACRIIEGTARSMGIEVHR